MNASREAKEGLQERLCAFIASQGLRDVSVGRLSQFTAGFSWLTFGFQASWGEEGRRERQNLVLRLGPPNGMFAPYRAEPEFEVLRCLKEAGVPVPEVFWHSEDVSILGGPFLIVERVEGEAPVPWTAHGGDAFEPEARVALGEQFLYALVALHAFEWRGTPATALPGGEDCRLVAQGQIEQWESILRRCSRRRLPMLEWALQWLKANAPAAPRIRIVHGDYRIGNFLVAEGRITAILDWELVHLGDPHEDLGWMCLHAFRGRSRYMCHLFERDHLYRRYKELSGMAVSPQSVAFYEAFGAFKLIVIHLAAAHAFEARGFNDLRLPAMGAQIPRILLQLESAIEAARP